MSTRRVPDFTADLAIGQRGKARVAEVLGDNASVEVHVDVRAEETGNVFVELSCLGKPSGLAATTAEHWGIVIGPVVLIAPVDLLREVAADWRLPKVPGGQRGSHPTVGVRIPVSNLIGLLLEASKTDQMRLM